MIGRFELCADKFRFRLKPAYGETLATSEAYESRAGSEKRHRVPRDDTGSITPA
jgi:uncharacterized protein YegP (UPF0339 family)